MNPQPNTPASLNEAVVALNELAEEAEGNGCDWSLVVEPRLQKVLAALGAAIDAREQEVPELLLGWKRYEKARKLSPFQWNRLHIRNLAGENFDAMIDSLPEPTTPVPTPSKALSPATVAQPVEGERDHGRERLHALYYAAHFNQRGVATEDAKALKEKWIERVLDAARESLRIAAQPCASQGCGGAVRQALKQIIEADDAQALTQQLIDIGRAALSADKSGGA